MAGGKRSGRVNRRQEMLQAAEKLMLKRGLTGVTTREISREVGCSEGALYVHFKGRLELLLAMFEESLPDMLGPLRTLRESVGRNSPQANLQLAMGGIYKFHGRIVPLFAGLFAEPKLLKACRESLASKGKGPHLSMAALEKYIVAERDLGRVGSDVDARVAAHLLMSASFLRAFLEQSFGVGMQPPWEKFAKQVVDTVVPRL